jgi:hypothetical protein
MNAALEYQAQFSEGEHVDPPEKLEFNLHPRGHRAALTIHAFREF